jgi:cytochrome c-type biogenesis protein CcmH/NrfF
MQPRLLESFMMEPGLTQSGDTVAALPRTEMFALLLVGFVVLAFTVAAWSAWREERRQAEAEVRSAIRHRAAETPDEAEELITSSV